MNHVNGGTLRDLLKDDRIHVIDGAMGTVLYDRGVFVNICYDALSLEQPELVGQIHRDYVDAGAEILETNTFGANPVKLSAYGLEAWTAEINQAAARLALEAADGRAFVLGAIGPLGVRLEPWGPTAVDEAAGFFSTQMTALLDAGVHGLILETFSDVNELETAIRTARGLTELPIFAQLTVGEGGSTAFGTDAAEGARRLRDAGADVVGLNCSVGPAAMLDAMEAMADAVDLPLAAQPNAGLPRTVGDRKIYLASPEYMARYALRLHEAGVRFLGGCCGTTPDHTRVLADTVRGLQPRHDSLRTPFVTTREAPLEPPPLAARSRWGAAISAGWATSIEVVPSAGWDATEMLEAAAQAGEACVDAVGIVDRPRGRSRMAALPAAALIVAQGGIEPLMHYTCRDRNMMGMISDLLGAAGLGLRNVLLVSGDPPVQGPYPDSTSVYDIDSIGLTNVVAGLNRGIDPGGARVGASTGFVTAVAVNPCAADHEGELRRFRYKVEAGADVAITQPVFELETLQRFREEADAADFPLILGLWPFASLRNAEFLAHEVPGVHVPDSVLRRMARAQEQGREHAREEGIAIAVEVALELGPHVQGVHVGTPGGDVEAALAVLAGLSRA